MSKGFCILRVEKIKSAGGVAVSLGHNTRERETVNASPELKDKNQVIGSQSVEEGMSHFRERLAQDKKHRKNAVLCLDYLITASNKSLSPKERTAYLNDALKWIRDRHGAENVLQVAVHRDENTDAHMHVLVVPLALNKRQEQKLNASKWLDGSKKLSEMQTLFAKEVGSKYELARGIEGSVAKHERVKRFYALVQKDVKKPEIQIPKPPKLGALYDLDQWKKDVEGMVFDQVRPALDSLGAKAERLHLVEKELNNAKATLYKTTTENKQLRKENERLRGLVYAAPVEEIQRIRSDREKELAQKKAKEQDRGMSR